MVEILCPHCEGEIELPDGEYGEFSCPLCEEDFIWEDDSSHGEVSFIASKNIDLNYKLAAIAVVVVFFLIFMVISSVISSIGEPDTSLWPLEQGEIVEITNEGRTVVGEGDEYYRVEIRFLYDDNERVWTLKCNAERDADAYVKDNPVGTIIDIRVNPVKGESPFFDIEGGCPSQPVPTAEIVGGVVCFGVLMAAVGIEKIIGVIRSKRQG